MAMLASALLITVAALFDGRSSRLRGGILSKARRGELPMVGINAVLLLLAVVVAWARFGPYPL